MCDNATENEDKFSMWITFNGFTSFSVPFHFHLSKR